MQTETQPSTLVTHFSTRDIALLATPDWHQATLHGYYNEISRREPDFRIDATLDCTNIQPSHDKVFNVSLRSNGKLGLAISRYNLVRCATDAVTEFNDLEFLAGEHADAIRGLGIFAIRIHNLDWLCEWVALHQQFDNSYELDCALHRTRTNADPLAYAI